MVSCSHWGAFPLPPLSSVGDVLAEHWQFMDEFWKTKVDQIDHSKVLAGNALFQHLKAINQGA